MRPNVLLVVLDTVRAKSCSLYGRDRPTTPGLERLARESVVFEHAIAPDTWTLPSHAAMFTGRYPTDIGVHAENMVLPDDASTLAEELAGTGYETAVFSSNPFLTHGSGLNRGFDHSHTSKIDVTLFDDAFDPPQYIRTRDHEQGLEKVSELLHELAGPPRAMAKNVLNAAYYKYRTTRSTDGDDSFDPSSDDGATESIAAFESWVDAVDEPFFGCLNFMEAHAPYRHRDRFLPAWATMDDVRRLDQDRWEYLAGDLELTDSRKELFEALYEAELRYLDERLESLWSTLRTRGLWEDTLVVVTSDHGELLGEHGLLFHDMNRLHEPLLHVPLLVKYPGGRHAGTSLEETTSLTRLPDVVRGATVDDSPDPEDLPQDLVKTEFLGMNQTVPDDRYASTYRDLAAQSRAVYEDGTKYVLYEDRATVTRDLPLPPSADEEDAEPVDSEAVPAHVREFAALDEAVTAGRRLDVDTTVEDRLQELGYR